MGFQITDKQVKRAGLDYWDKLDISYYDSTEEFFEKNKDGKFYYFTTKGEIAHSDMEYENNAYLVFGKETKGLPEELLKENHDTCVRLPMRGIIRSLNLSNAVCVGTYEVLRQWGYPELSQKGKLTKYEW
jgi:tRNA (cytidine/uridine-2'-O-)-methyltransferase